MPPHSADGVRLDGSRLVIDAAELDAAALQAVRAAVLTAQWEARIRAYVARLQRRGLAQRAAWAQAADDLGVSSPAKVRTIVRGY